jgi:peptidoglycan/xylan/chitin deacetylase (PgdA/CDA1 family)
VSIKQSVLTLAGGLGLGKLARAITRRQLRILCYHGIWITPGHRFGNCTFIEPDHFARRMTRLRRLGMSVLGLGEAVERLAHDDLPPDAVVITIDDGWVTTLTHMLPVLEAEGLPATLYATSWYSDHRLPVVNLAVRYLAEASGRTVDVDAEVAAIEALPFAERREALRALGRRLAVAEDWLDNRQFELMTWAELAETERRGLDIQLHTHRHVEMAGGVDRLPQELADNRAWLEKELAAPALEHFCFPSGSFHADARAMLVAAGIRSATLTDPGLNAPGCDPYALRRFLDCRDVGDAVFDAYLTGLLHFTARVTPG